MARQLQLIIGKHKGAVGAVSLFGWMCAYCGCVVFAALVSGQNYNSLYFDTLKNTKNLHFLRSLTPHRSYRKKSAPLPKKFFTSFVDIA